MCPKNMMIWISVEKIEKVKPKSCKDKKWKSNVFVKAFMCVTVKYEYLSRSKKLVDY